MLKLIHGLKISSRIYLIVVLVLLIAGAGLLDVMHRLVEQLEAGPRYRIQAAVEEAHAVVRHFAEEAAGGRLTEEQAKASALEAVKAMRFGDQ